MCPGETIESTSQIQPISRLQVYTGSNASFTLYDDDGTTYAYEKGAGNITQLVWNDKTQTMSYHGASIWSQSHPQSLDIIGR